MNPTYSTEPSGPGSGDLKMRQLSACCLRISSMSFLNLHGVAHY